MTVGTTSEVAQDIAELAPAFCLTNPRETEALQANFSPIKMVNLSNPSSLGTEGRQRASDPQPVQVWKGTRWGRED